MVSKLFLRKALCALLRFRPCNGRPSRETNQRRLGQRSDWNVVRSSLFQTPPPFVVNLGRGHVPVTEQLLDLDDVHPGIQEQRRRGRPQRVRRVDAALAPSSRCRPQPSPLPPAATREAGRGSAWTRLYIVTAPIGARPSFWLRELSRARKSGPFVSSALAIYAAIASAAGKVQPDAAVLVALLMHRGDATCRFATSGPLAVGDRATHGR